MNRFRKRQNRRHQQSNASFNHVESKPKAGITISVAPKSRSPSPQQNHPDNTAQTLDNVLPPASDYRQSLIMPHLTRRFTFLRAPDGSLVSPDAMRAHLRAQRARARATSGPLAAFTDARNFLTEEEENEIIEQLRIQAKAEGRDFDSEKAQEQEIWNNRYAHGTDGFGSWATSYSSGADNLKRLAESLGDLTVSSGSRSSNGDSSYSFALSDALNDQRQTPTSRRTGDVGGSLFSGRSSERDLAYLRNLDREKKETKLETVREAPNLGLPNSCLDESRPPPSYHLPVLDHAPIQQHQSSSSTQHPLHCPTDGQQVPEPSSSLDEHMPGDFHAAEKSASQTQTDGFVLANSPVPDLPLLQSDFLQVPLRQGNGVDPLPQQRQSKLLTSLSPEAFKRVSTALEEVYGLIAAQGNTTSQSASNPNQIVEKSAHQAAIHDSDPARRSQESDERSFASAVSDVHSPNSVVSVDSQTNQNADNDNEQLVDRLGEIQIEDGGLNINSIGFGQEVHVDFSNSDSTNTLTSPVYHSQTSPSIPHKDYIVHESHLQDDPTPQMSTVSTMDPIIETRSESDGTWLESREPPSRVESTASDLDKPLTDSLQNLQPLDASVESDQSQNFKVAGSEPSNHLPSASLNRSHSPASSEMESSSMRSPVMADNPIPGMVARPAATAVPPQENSGLAFAFAREAAHPPSLHGRTASSDRPPHDLQEQPSLSSVRRLYRHHSRTATASSVESGIFGHYGTSVPPLSPRSSGATSPIPVLHRSARSPSYFPPPSSGNSMKNYAAGFKPPSAISPEAFAAAAIHSRTGSVHGSSSPFMTNDSFGFRPFHRTRDSISTSHSQPSPLFPGSSSFSPVAETDGTWQEGDGASTSIDHRRVASGLASEQQQSESKSGPVGSDWHHQPRAPKISVGGSSSSSHLDTSRISSVTPRSDHTDPFPLPPPPETVGLLPHPPFDPQQAIKWRSTYGENASDVASIKTTSDLGANGETRHHQVEGLDEEDWWAKVANAASTATSQETRPVSAFPPNATQDQLADAGITIGQLANYQEQLVQSASHKQIVPPLPMPSLNRSIPPLDKVQQSTKSLIWNDFLTASNMEASDSGPVPVFQHPNEINTVSFPEAPGDLSMTGSPISHSISELSQPTRSEVMYDVTTSHRPTSPPPRSIKGSMSGLPSLRDLNNSLSVRARESMSLAQAVEDAASFTINNWQTSFPSTGRESSMDHRSIVSATSGHVSTLTRGRDSASVPIVEEPTDDHPSFAFLQNGRSSPRLYSYSHDTATQNFAEGHQDDELSRTTSNDAAADKQLQSPIMAHSTWSDPASKKASAETSFKSQLIDDVAAQARAATRALKGVDDGSVPTPPFRTKSLSRRKSFKKVAKQISSPQLISTTQKLDRAVPVARPEMPQNFKAHKKAKSPGWKMMSASPVQQELGVKRDSSSPIRTLRQNGATHHRRSSSFGHMAQSEMNGWDHPGPETATYPMPMQVHHGSSLPTSPVNHSVNSPYSASSASGGNGSLSRLFSKIRPRKHSEANFGASSIDPFPNSPLGSNDTHRKASPSLPMVSASYSPQTQPPFQSPTSKPGNLTSLQGDNASTDTFKSPRSSPPKVRPFLDSTSSMSNSNTIHRPSTFLRQQDSELAEEVRIGQRSEAAMVDGSVEEQELAMSVSTSGRRIQQQWETDPAAVAGGDAASVVDSRAHADDDVSSNAHDMVTSSASDSLQTKQRTVGSLAPAASLSERASSGDDTPCESSAAQQRKSRADQRKSLRDTIVRRTIIIPADYSVDDKRRSTYSTPSRRKSRKPGSPPQGPLPWPDHLTPSASGLSTSKADDTLSLRDDLADDGTRSASPRAYKTAVPDRSSTPPEATGVRGVAHGCKPSLEILPDSPLPSPLPSATSGISTLSSQQSLKPITFNGVSPFQATSRIHSSYAGSLYDSYFESNQEDVGDLIDDDPRRRTKTLQAEEPDRTSRYAAETRKHIEVTERADGSVVWQVIAGLADRGSVYSDYDSRRLSNESSFSFLPRNRDSMAGNGSGTRDSLASDTYHFPFNNAGSFAMEDSRSLFAKPRGHQKSFSFDGEVPPMPGLPPPSSQLPTNPISSSIHQPKSSNLNDPSSSVANPTRIVYHSDAQLASLLDVLAHGKDSAKFEFQIISGSNAGGGNLQSSRPVSTWTKAEVFDADDIESHRSRVEAEIYTLLNQPGLAP